MLFEPGGAEKILTFEKKRNLGSIMIRKSGAEDVLCTKHFPPNIINEHHKNKNGTDCVLWGDYTLKKTLKKANKEINRECNVTTKVLECEKMQETNKY